MSRFFYAFISFSHMSIKVFIGVSAIFLSMHFAPYLNAALIQDSNPKELVKIIRNLLTKGELAKAIELSDAGLKTNPKNSEFFFLKARAYQDLRRNTDALANYSIAIYLNPKFVNAFINRGLVRGALQDVNGALIDLDQALVLQPNNTAALLNRGVTYAGLNKPSLAIQDFNKAIQINPNYPDAYRNRGLTKHLLGDKDGACDDWHKSKNLGINEATEWLTKYCMQQK